MVERFFLVLPPSEDVPDIRVGVDEPVSIVEL
jgi:hypothetical protein